MSISINVTPAASGGTFSVGSTSSQNVTLEVTGGIGPPGTDVALAAGTGISIVTVNNTATISSTLVIPDNLADLADVTLGNVTTGQVLAYNGTAWTAAADNALTLSTSAGSDLGTAAIGTSGEAARADHVHNLPSLSELSDVTLSSLSSGQVLAYNGTAWTAAADNALTLSTSAGADLGTAAIGTSGEAARADHVHNLPTFAEITNGTATVTGNLTLNASTGSVTLNGGTAGSGSLTLNCEQNTHGVTIASPAHAVGATYTLTLPATAGSANQVLTTDGTGSLSWSNGTSGGGISWSSVPSDSNANGTAGQVAYDSQGYFYLHDGTQWRRIQLATFGVVPTERLLTEAADSLLSETGDYIAHDGNPAQITITSQPQNATTSGATASFSVTATVSDSSTITYQWQEFTGTVWANITAATSSTLTLGGLTSSDNGNQYRVNVGSDTAATVTSDVATLTVSVNLLVQSAPQNTTVAAGNDATFSATLEPAQNWYVYGMTWERADSGSPSSWSVVETESLAAYDILSSSNVTQNYTWASASSFDDGDLFRAAGSAFEYGLVHTAGALADKYAIAQGKIQYGLTVSGTYFSVTQGGTIQAQYLSTGGTGSAVTYNLLINSVAADSGVTALTNGGQPSGATHTVSSGDQIRIDFSLSGSAVPAVILLFTPTAGIQTATTTSAPATLTVQ